MEDPNMLEKIAELEERIALLPKGSVGQKTINGREYAYQRWTENKRRREKYIPAGEAEAMKQEIQERKALEKELKALRRKVPAPAAPIPAAHTFRTGVRTAGALRGFSEPVKGFGKRGCFWQLQEFLYGQRQDRVLILCGLHRTGKTVLIRQALAGMTDEELSKTAFIQITGQDTLSSVNQDVKYLEETGFRCVFIDDVTLMEDFISAAALFADVYAAGGMKIVLSGADSLGFLFSGDDRLSDRCILLRTTYIPYRESEQVLGAADIDAYIRCGGTMSPGGSRFGETSARSGRPGTDGYADSAVLRDMEHSLRHFQDSGRFRCLQELYGRGELNRAVRQVTEDISRRFTLEVLAGDFRPDGPETARKNPGRDREQPDRVPDRIDLPGVTRRLRRLLEIREPGEQSVRLSHAQIREIREYLDLLELTCEVGVYALPGAEKLRDRTVVSRPGLRYVRTDALVRSLLDDPIMNDLSLPERSCVLERIRREIRGRMAEDIVLLETARAYPRKEVFVLQFDEGVFNMTVFDPAAASCEIYGIRHGAEIGPEQARLLPGPEQCAMIEHRYGPIAGKSVLYRGVTQDADGIRYINIEEYLKGVR